MDPIEHIIIIGSGMTGYKFCEKMADKDVTGQYKLTVFGEEPRPAYDRVHLTSYYTGTPADELLMAPAGWYSDNNIDLITNELVVQIDLQQKTICTQKGRTMSFDKLVLATGSSAFVPPIPGKDKNGVFVYRTLEDLDAIKSHVKGAKKAAVVGGGLLGLEAAKALLDDGLETYVIEFAPRLMPRQLDEQGANILKQQLEDFNLKVLTSTSTQQIRGNGSVQGMEFTDGTDIDVDLIVISAGIRPRDELAKAAGIKTGERGGIWVNNRMETTAPNVYAIGECALARGMVWGLVAPCYEMADVLATNLTGGSKEFQDFDMSTKLKLIGTDVASFGDAFGQSEGSVPIVFENKAGKIYKRINLSADGKHLLGGILVGDAADYNMLLTAVNTKMPLPPNPEDLILGARGGGGLQMSVLDLPDEAQICSCENVNKAAICAAIEDGAATVPAIKKCTKAGTGCGGCVPMIDDLITETFKASGKVVRKTICEHFDHTRQELLDIVKVKKIQTYNELLHDHGKGSGCEICKPLVASILASTWNEHLPKQATIQDTNDRFLANIQRRGTYSVVPRIPGGEITPDKLIVIGQVAKKYDLYTKITGGQRIDLFGARVDQLPQIWEELIAAGFESGQAYGKSLRTVKSCVGSTWCRYGLHDSVGLAVELENRYKGVRSPHKLKGGVSGCIRECAEARGKDFGVIATEKGWNVYVCGNGGANPKHAVLLAADVEYELVLRYLDRFIMFYIRTADTLTRTAKWLDKLDGGIEYLKDVVINDSLGIGNELEQEMKYLIDTYACEWKGVVESPELRKRFVHFVNTDQPDENVKFKPYREQKMPLEWVK